MICRSCGREIEDWPDICEDCAIDIADQLDGLPDEEPGDDH